jgi:transcriptional regulator with XRE-family HTH domain
VPTLDDLLGGGLVLGDNVVWVADDPDGHEAFWRAVLSTGPARRRYIGLGPTGLPRGLGGDVEALHLDPRAGEASPAALEAAILDPRHAEGSRIVVDGLDDLVLAWGAPAAARFYARVCPRLFDLGTVAYWTASRQVVSSALVEQVSKVAQCVFDLRPGRLRVAKAEGRPAKLQGAMVECRLVDGTPVLSREHAVGRVGEGLRRLRRERNLTQGQVAALAGVTPAAISQAESGRRGLSLDTLVPLCEALGIGLDDLLGTSGAADHVLARRDRRAADGGVVALLDDPGPGLRAYLVRLQPEEEGTPPFAHKGLELLLVGSGLVLVDLGDTTPVVRAGDALMVRQVPIQRWTNLGPGPAQLFWLVSG